MKIKLLKFISSFSLILAAGAISGASRLSIYQGDESKELKKMKIF